jgi:hypothetical protein
MWYGIIIIIINIIIIILLGQVFRVELVYYMRGEDFNSLFSFIFLLPKFRPENCCVTKLKRAINDIRTLNNA